MPCYLSGKQVGGLPLCPLLAVWLPIWLQYILLLFVAAKTILSILNCLFSEEGKTCLSKYLKRDNPYSHFCSVSFRCKFPPLSKGGNLKKNADM